MTDTTPKSEGKKYQLVKIAIELNISKEHIVDYLKKKGFDVSKPLLMKVDEETYQDILKTFRKDKELADKYHKKVEDFKKKTQEKEAEKKQKAEEKKVEKADETVKKVAEKEKQIPEVVTEVAAAKPEEKKEEIIQPEEPKTTVIEAEQKAEKTPPAEVIEKTEQVPETKVEAVPEAPVAEAKAEPKAEEIAQTIETKAPIEQKVEEVQPQPVELKTTAEEPKTEEVKPPAVEEAVEEQKTKVAASAEEQEKAEEHAVTSLKEIIEKRKELVVKGKIDLDEVSEVVEHKVETKEKAPVKEKAKEKEKEREVEKEKEREKEKAEEKEPKKKKEKKPKKKRLREEIKKKKQAEEEISEKGKKLKKVKSKVIDEKEIDEAIRRTFESMDVGSYKTSFKKKKKKEKQEQLKQQQEEVEKQKSILKVTEFISVNELSKLMNVPVSEVIAKCMSLGLMVSINQRLNLETITLVADEFGYTVELQTEFVSDELVDTPDNPEDLKPRPPIVTIMGHVDHGKTSLLDYIRKSQIVAGEAGGITQHIGAYKVTLANGKEITFLDTPGHEAFTAMRARGAQVTDIVVLVVAADDSVMPQTVEAINHAQAAGVPIIVAVNKIDKPGVNIDRIYKQLSERNILVEKWGGKYQSAEISAKYGKNIDDLLDKILLEAELLNLRANPNRMARGILIEVKLDKGKGIVGTVLVQKGTLKVGDPFVAGIVSGRVRAMYDERENRLSKAGPATPVQVIGFNEMPQAGDELIVVESDKLAHQISLQRTQIKRAQDRSMVRHITLDEISRQIKIGGVKDLYIIVKGDVDGSVEAISDALLKLSTEEVRVQIIHKGVGAIVEADVLLAEASQAIIIGFQVRPNLNAKKLAEAENVEIRLYNIIYDVINDVKSAIEGMLSPEVSEITTATVEVRDVIKISKVGTVAGCYVTDGTIHRNDKVRIIRDGIVIYDGAIETLKRFKDDVREVVAGYECGIKIENFNDIKVGDVIEGYKLTEKKRKLDYVSKN